MKNKFKRIHSKKGMTYVEVLVALSILALIVVVFTPILMYSYEKLYTAGDINIKTYEVKSYIEESLAVRSNNPKVRTKFGLQGLSE
ncbi:MAG: type II secretion system protein, partial [Clostridiales bacterium]|nr:type II secretion system protein [Clostridiales bacterium]